MISIICCLGWPVNSISNREWPRLVGPGHVFHFFQLLLKLLHLQLVLSSFVIVLALLIIFLRLVVFSLGPYFIIFSLPSLLVAGASVSLFLLFWNIGCDGPRHDLLEQSQHPTFAVIAFLLISSLIIYFDLIIELPLNIRYVLFFIWLGFQSTVKRLQKVLHLLAASILSLDTKCHFHLQILNKHRTASEQLRSPDGGENLAQAQEVVSERIA